LDSGAILVHVKRSPKEMTMDRKKLIAGVVAVLALGGGVAIAALSAVPGKAVETEFERDAGSGRVEHLLLGFDRLRKRPRIKSLRFKAMAGLGAGAGAILATTARQGLERSARPSGSNGDT
jgi:hypothetical protein